MTRELLMALKVIHLLAVIALVGGALSYYLLVRPTIRALPPAQAIMVAERAGRRLQGLTWAAALTLLVTGLVRLVLLERWDELFTLSFYGGGYGSWLLATVVLWAVLVAGAGATTFYLIPEVTRRLLPRPRGPSTLHRRLWSSLFHSREVDQPFWITVTSWVTWSSWASLGLVLVAGLLRLAATGTWAEVLTNPLPATPEGRWLLAVLVLWLSLALVAFGIRFILVPAHSKTLPMNTEPTPEDAQRWSQRRATAARLLEQTALAGLITGVLATIAASSLAFGGWF